MRFRFLFIVAASLLLVQTGFAQGIAADAELQKGYLLGPGDEITGKVLGEAQFDFVATVNEDGKIEVPFF